PTSGLDPNQLEDIRKLIIELGKKKTVLLSTHIMQEVEAICDRVIIINKGEIVADKNAKELQKHEDNKQVVIVEFDKNVSKSQLNKVPEFSSFRHVSDNKWLIETTGSSDIRRIIAEFGKSHDLLILEMRLEERTMEQVFKSLTK